MSSSPDRGPVLKEGEKVAHYEVREFVGEGPLGRVYKVLDTQFDVIAALKVLHPAAVSDRAVRQAVVDVFRSLTEFESDGFVKIFDAGTQGDRTYVAMDFLEGLSLRRLMEVRAGAGGKFTWEEAEPIIESVCQALETMRPGEVHGDLKPENVVILPDAVKLTDLGLARVMPPAQFVSTQVVGGNPYLAPELAEHGERLTADPAVDVYALGVILYQLLTGVLPSSGARNPSKLAPTVPSGVDALVARALDPNPDARFAHPAELHLEIARVMGKPEIAASVEIFMHDLPARPPFVKPEPAAPAPAPAPAAKSKSLFDEALLDAATETKPKEAPQIRTAAAAPAPKSKTPLIAGAVAAALVVAGAVGFFAVRGGEEQAPVKAAQTQPRPDVPQRDLKAEAKKGAEDAVAKAEKARDDALKVNAEKGAPDLFVSAMKSLRDATDNVRAEKYADAVSLAVEAERAFGDAIIKGVAAQSQKPAKEPKAEVKEAAAPAPKAVCPSDMVHIAAGSFTMGAPSGDPDRNPGEKYNEATNVASFCIDRYEFPNKKGAKPARGVTWAQAKASCEQAGKRLCTETEWEKSCKGPGNTKFPYGAAFNAAACNTEDAAGNDRSLAASGSFAACKSGYGVYDLSGNVWEWTESKLQSNLQDRVLRGGSYTRPDYHDRCANRYNSMPSVKDDEFGFRCCAEAND